MAPFTVCEISIDQIDTRVGECLVSVWEPGGNPEKASEMERSELKSHREAVVLIAKNDANQVVGFRFAHSIPDNGRVVGFVFTPSMLPCVFEDVLYDSNGGVHPEYRRQGIARALLHEQHRLAHQRGYKKMATGVAISLKPMIILNLQEGFDIIELIEARTDEWHTKTMLFLKQL